MTRSVAAHTATVLDPLEAAHAAATSYDDERARLCHDHPELESPGWERRRPLSEVLFTR